MTLLAGGLSAVFGAALGVVFEPGVLHKVVRIETGTGGFAVTRTDHPVRATRNTLSAADRAASGLPAGAVHLTVLRAGLQVAIDLDDGLTLGDQSFRVTGVDTDPAGAAFVLTAVPA